MVQTDYDCMLKFAGVYELTDCAPCSYGELTCQHDNEGVDGKCEDSEDENSSVMVDSGFEICPGACKVAPIWVQGFPTASKAIFERTFTRKTCRAKAPWVQ